MNRQQGVPMRINKKRQTTLTAVFVAAALALSACGGDDGTTDVTVDATVLPSTTAAAATETTAAETTTAPTTTAPSSTTSGPNMTTGPAQVTPEGWEVHDPGTGYTIALPPRWIDATDVIKGEMKPEDLPGFAGTSLSPEQLQESFGAALELMTLFAIDTQAATEEFAPNINILTTPLAEDISADQAKGQFESQLSQLGEVRNSEVTSVDGFDAIRTEFTTKVGGLDARGVQVAVIQPGSLTVITYTGLEVPNNLDQIINTFQVTG